MRRACCYVSYASCSPAIPVEGGSSPEAHVRYRGVGGVRPPVRRHVALCLHIDECRCALAAASADSSARLIGGPARAVTGVRVGDGDVSMALVCSACRGYAARAQASSAWGGLCAASACAWACSAAARTASEVPQAGASSRPFQGLGWSHTRTSGRQGCSPGGWAWCSVAAWMRCHSASRSVVRWSARWAW